MKITGGQQWKHKVSQERMTILKKDDPPVAYRYESYTVPTNYVDWIVKFPDSEDKKENYIVTENYVFENYDLK